MERGRRGAHQGGALFERDFLREWDCVARRYCYIFRVAAIDVMTDHFNCGAELLVPRFTVRTFPAGDVVVQTNTVSCFDTGYLCPHPFHLARHLMTECYGQPAHA